MASSGDTDLIDALAGLDPGSPLAVLRRQRPDQVRYTQGSHDVLIEPAEPRGVDLVERAAVALRVARLSGDTGLQAHYHARLHALEGGSVVAAAVDGGRVGGAGWSPRLAAILHYVDLATTAPRTGTKADLDALKAVGLDAQAIVTIAQIVSFVSYQMRLLAGLRLLREEA
jgi:CMD domain protein